MRDDLPTADASWSDPTFPWEIQKNLITAAAIPKPISSRAFRFQFLIECWVQSCLSCRRTPSLPCFSNPLRSKSNGSSGDMNSMHEQLPTQNAANSKDCQQNKLPLPGWAPHRSYSLPRAKLQASAAQMSWVECSTPRTTQSLAEFG